MQMRICIFKLGVVISIYGYFGEETHVRTISRWLGFIKWILRRFWRTHGFINLKTFVRTQILPYVRTHTLRMKSTQSFMH